MSSIDDIVARSRLKGGFSERKSFTLARKQAIQKMRQFALADPHFFVLELIQSAVASGATYISISADSESFSISYVGGAFTEQELGQLFDFLFAGKDQVSMGHVRGLALGINALLIFDPEEIVVESGDGTLAGTTRMVVGRDAETVDIGKPEKPLMGTYVRATDLDRRRVKGKRSLYTQKGYTREYVAIEERCLTAPIPLLFNDRPVFGAVAHRIPGLLGYRRVLQVDEGDLYGVIGMGPEGFGANFKLLTYGVWIQSLEHPLLPGRDDLGGIICFDALRKTVDHSGIVKDSVFKEMWARLTPYAHQLVSGKPSSAHGRIELLGAGELDYPSLRRLLRSVKRVLLTEKRSIKDERTKALMAELANRLEAPVLMADKKDIPWIKALGSATTALLAVDPSDSYELSILAQNPAEPPPRPYLASPIPLAELPMEELAQKVAELHMSEAREEDKRLAARFRELLEGDGSVRSHVYTPKAASESLGLSVGIVTVDRLVWTGTVESRFVGHVLHIVLPDVSPAALLRPVRGDSGKAYSLADYIARCMASAARETLEDASGRVLRRIQSRKEAESPSARRIVLNTLMRYLIARFREGRDGKPEVSFSVNDASAPSGLLSVPLFKVMEQVPGRPDIMLSMKDLAGLMNENHGFVYGAIPSVPPDLQGLDISRILVLDRTDERMLLALLGESAYIRVDRRDLLASFRGVLCRDLAVGLRTYPDFPLLTEGEDSSAWPADLQRECEETLVASLKACFLGLDPPCPQDPERAAVWEENRRHACRHLIRYICRKAQRCGVTLPEEHYGVGDLPLFLGTSDIPCTFRQIASALLSEKGLSIHLRPSFSGSELGLLTSAALSTSSAGSADQGPMDELMTSPFVALLLKPLGRLRLPLDFGLPRDTDAAAGVEEAEGTRFLASVEVRSDDFAGVVGLAAQPENEPRIFLLQPKSGKILSGSDLALRYRMTGLLRVSASAMDETLVDRVTQGLTSAGEQLYSDLLERLVRLDPADEPYNEALAYLLRFAGERMQLSTQPDGTVINTVTHPLAFSILELPLFPTRSGVLVSANHLVDQFRSHGSEAFAARRADGSSLGGSCVVSSELSHPLRGWIEEFLDGAKVIRPAGTRQHRPAAVRHMPHEDPTANLIAYNMTYWINSLRPDDESFGGVLRPNDKMLAWADQDRVSFQVVIRDPLMFMSSTSDESCFAFTGGSQSMLAVNSGHWIYRWVAEEIHDRPTAEEIHDNPARLAFLVMAGYAYLNALLDPVTNVHEQAFQANLARALQTGAFRLISPATSEAA